MHPERPGDSSAAATRWTVESSLRTLGLDSIDLVQVHGVYSIDMDTVLAPAAPWTSWSGSGATVEYRPRGNIREVGEDHVG
jgi:aryl-alcohol dehydrogenase-like predicted oxidoreductase